MIFFPPRNWNYSKLMPILKIDGLELGALPLFQLLLIPALTLLLARTLGRRAEKLQVQALPRMQRHP